MRHAPLAGGCEDLWAVPVSCRSSHPAAHENDGSIHTWHGIASHLSVSCTAMHGVPCVRCVLFAMRHALGMTMFKAKSAIAVCRLCSSFAHECLRMRSTAERRHDSSVRRRTCERCKCSVLPQPVPPMMHAMAAHALKLTVQQGWTRGI